MNNVPKLLPRSVIFSFFWIGLLSSLAFRVLILCQKYQPSLVRPMWYVGVVGYMFFFMYRYYISQRRKRTIARSEIIAKISTGANLSVDDRAAALYLLNSIRKSQEDWNYLAIFVMSIVTIALDLLLPGK